jgi:predicted nucleotidyltransferase
MSRLRALGPGFDSNIVAEIDRRLASVSAEGMAILLAVESGSRAWGFPSPDSDYDCRFVYARARQDYTSLFPPRDVVEFPPDKIFDVNGWDLAKALRLLLKGNAVVVEWLTSPYTYDGSSSFRADMLELASRVLAQDAVARHYLHLGERQRRTYFADTNLVPFKKLFYALRPAVALRWLRLHPDEAVAPMDFHRLVAQSDLPSDVMEIVSDLMARKAETRELGEGLLPAPVGGLIDSEFSLAHDLWDDTQSSPTDEDRAAADTLFRKWIGV